ncbi:MAG: DUF177 domain-containing protein [Magnetococcales bacterium]|nr:DUF177 domain-containing protein [Magnetococcales bacterium]
MHNNLGHIIIDTDLLYDTPRILSGYLVSALFADVMDDTGGTLLSDVWVDATLRRAVPSQQIHLRGTTRTTAQFECALCLTPFQHEMVLELDRCFMVGDDPADDSSETQMTMDIVFLPNNRLELLPVIEEELVLGLPMMPRCHDDCAGLCPGCGSNLNRDPCSCSSDREEHSMARLRYLLQ